MRRFLIIALLIFSTNLFAENSPFIFLRNSASARAAAMAGCFVSITNDASAVFYNPASIYTVTNKHFSTTFLKNVLDINSGNITYIKPLENGAVLAGQIAYSNYGSFDYTNEYGDKTGKTFGASDITAGITYANQLDSNLYYGATGKFVYVGLEKAHSMAFAADVGLLYNIPSKRTSIGLSILHAGSQITTFDGYTEKLPLDIRLGISNRLRGLPLMVNFSFHHLADQTNSFFDKFLNFSVAGELYLGKYVQARLGYDNTIRRLSTITTDRQFTGLSAGIGIQAKEYLNFDYGIAQVGSAAFFHRFSLSMDL
jgi:hypothetical protein